MLLFGRSPADGHYLTDVLAPMLVTAIGLGLSFVRVTIAATSGAPPAQAGLASCLVNTTRQPGMRQARRA